MLAVASPDFQARVAAATEAQRIGIYRDAAYQFIAQHPLDAARLYAIKLKAFWWGSDSTGLEYPAFWTAMYDAWYVTVLAFAAVGIWAMWRDEQGRSVAVLIVASLALVAMSQALFYVEGRHRLAVEPLIVVLAGVGLVQAVARGYLPSPDAHRLPRARDNPT